MVFLGKWDYERREEIPPSIVYISRMFSFFIRNIYYFHNSNIQKDSPIEKNKNKKYPEYGIWLSRMELCSAVWLVTV